MGLGDRWVGYRVDTGEGGVDGDEGGVGIMMGIPTGV